jgi:aquaporin Z
MATKNTASSKKSVTKVKATPVAPAKAKSTKVTTVKAVSATTPATKLPMARSMSSMQIGAAVAEFVGAFMLAAAFIAGQGQPIIVLFAAIGVVMAVGALSGAHVNPAVTIAALVTRKVSAMRAVVYIVAQVLGAMLALVVLNAFMGQAPEVTGQAAMYSQTATEVFSASDITAGKEWAVFFAELLGATILGFAIAGARKQLDTASKALTTGLGYFLGLLVGGSAAVVVGATTILNPAVAVALQAFDFSSVWPFAVYILASVLGAVIGFLLSDLLSSERFTSTDA